MRSVRLVLISDTHGRHEALSMPEGDVLIHAGDVSERGSLREVRAFDRFLGSLRFRHRIVIAGNHDFCFEQQPAVARQLVTNAIYLEDRSLELAGVRFYGSPWQPWFFDWAFNLHRGAPIRAKWDLIPEGTDVLITHGPPMGHGDTTVRGDRVGCEELAAAVARVRPRLHVFGHIHEGYGQWSRDGTTFVNASTCDEVYVPCNPPVVFDLEVPAGDDTR
jgi:Icc-related predicted phosphoesterase